MDHPPSFVFYHALFDLPLVRNFAELPLARIASANNLPTKIHLTLSI